MVAADSSVACRLHLVANVAPMTNDTCTFDIGTCETCGGVKTLRLHGGSYRLRGTFVHGHSYDPHPCGAAPDNASPCIWCKQVMDHEGDDGGDQFGRPWFHALREGNTTGKMIPAHDFEPSRCERGHVREEAGDA